MPLPDTDPSVRPSTPPPVLPPALRGLAAFVAVGLSAAILLGGRVPEAVQLLSLFWDKLTHALAYGVLAGAWCVAFGGRRALIAVAIALATGLLDEWLQRSLPNRQADPADLLADFIGAAIGAWLASAWAVRLWSRWRRRRLPGG